MLHFLSIDGPVYALAKKLANILFMSVLWLACSIPLITMGASTAALYCVAMKIVREEDFSISKTFFQSFKANLKQGVVFSIIFFLLGAVLYFDYMIAPSLPGTLGSIASVLFVIFGLCVIMVSCYTFALVSQFENTIRQTLKNAVLLSIAFFPRTLLIMAINALPFVALVFLTQFFFKFLPLWLILGPGCIAWFCAAQFCQIFKKLMPEEETAGETEEALPQEIE